MIDIHTHNTVQSKYTKVVNYSMINSINNDSKDYFSAGIHPWHLDEIELQKNKLLEIVNNKNCIAIGECGLDKACNSNLDLQKSAFNFQCSLANQLNKPLIIHCVKAHFDVLKILEDYGIKKVIFHGFNNKYTILEKIIEKNYAVSFGEALLSEKSQAHALIGLIPKESFFLETDDSDESIETIYQKVASILGIDLDELIKQQNINFKNFIQ